MLGTASSLRTHLLHLTIPQRLGPGQQGPGSHRGRLAILVPRPSPDHIALQRDGTVNVVQLVVKPACIAQDVPGIVLPPEGRQRRLAVVAHGLGHRHSWRGHIRGARGIGGAIFSLAIIGRGASLGSVLGLVSASLPGKCLLEVFGAMHGMQLVVETAGIAQGLIVC